MSETNRGSIFRDRACCMEDIRKETPFCNYACIHGKSYKSKEKKKPLTCFCVCCVIGSTLNKICD